jgi:hypothetical protein
MALVIITVKFPAINFTTALLPFVRSVAKDMEIWLRTTTTASLIFQMPRFNLVLVAATVGGKPHTRLMKFSVPSAGPPRLAARIHSLEHLLTSSWLPIRTAQVGNAQTLPETFSLASVQLTRATHTRQLASLDCILNVESLEAWAPSVLHGIQQLPITMPTFSVPCCFEWLSALATVMSPLAPSM